LGKEHCLDVFLSSRDEECNDSTLRLRSSLLVRCIAVLVGVLLSLAHLHEYFIYDTACLIIGSDTVQIMTALTKQTANARFIEFAALQENAITRTQIEMRDGLVFMRAKRRNYVFT
jgi:hypothetical protein